MGDVFLALGYDNVRYNVHKAGREVDVVAKHRYEARQAIAECKATKDLIGGADLNKFYGTLDLERRRAPGTDTQGYFVSLAGFRETAVEQELDAGRARFVTLDGEGVIEELVAGRILIAPEAAAARAGTLIPTDATFTPAPEYELLVHETGYVWCLFFGPSATRTHFVLVHADGTTLADEPAASILAADQDVGGHLSSLQRLRTGRDPECVERQELARRQYYAYLAREYGHITLEGLPADQEVGSRRISLDELFVPLHLRPLAPAGSVEYEDFDDDEDEDDSEHDALTFGPSHGSDQTRESVADVLARENRLVVLAPPGAGKSTLLKRLATAYASDGAHASGDVPPRNWMPIVVRCRQLGPLCQRPLREVLRAIPEWAEIPDVRDDFDDLITRSLQQHEILLLVDGLDEIADEAARVAFVQQLRTFLATYPRLGIVVTSREAGFRVLGGALDTTCKAYLIAEFNDADIAELTTSWHRVVVGDSDQTLSEAATLASRISSTDRVRRLARNPLLLTTLLLVKRWVGDLPRKRTVLYAKAIDVLLMSWNVQGHDPIDPDEAIPQLAFVAFSMTRDGRQTIVEPELKRVLREARLELPEVLAYAKLPISAFIQRIEDRSSVLSLTGHVLHDGRLVPEYEFKHLTFQEYLAAVAVVEGFLPATDNGGSLEATLSPFLSKTSWREVVPLTAVLAGRRASSLIERLVEMVHNGSSATRAPAEGRVVPPSRLLASCLADEAQVAPPLVEDACKALLADQSFSEGGGFSSDLLGSRYGTTLERLMLDGYFSETDSFAMYAGTMAQYAQLKAAAGFRNQEASIEKVYQSAIEVWKDGDVQEQTLAALLLMNLAYQSSLADWLDAEVIDWIRDLIEHDKSGLSYAACWAVAWLGHHDFLPVSVRREILERTYRLWRAGLGDAAERMAAWSFSEVAPIPDFRGALLTADESLLEFVKEQARDEPESPRRQDRAPAALMLGYYLQTPWTDDELMELCANQPGVVSGPKRVAKLLGAEVSEDGEVIYGRIDDTGGE